MSTKSLSIRQPWAELILSGRKTIELRTWSTPYRGRIWLHAPQKKDTQMEQYFNFKDLPTGCYVGYFSVAGIPPMTAERWRDWRDKHLDQGPFVYGSYAWLIKNPVRFKNPIMASGSLGLFEPEASILEMLESAETE